MLAEKVDLFPRRLSRERADLPLVRYFAPVRLFIIKEIIDHADWSELLYDLCLSLLVLFDATDTTNVIGINQGQSILLLARR
jgi:hypothetical protein